MVPGFQDLLRLFWGLTLPVPSALPSGWPFGVGLRWPIYTAFPQGLSARVCLTEKGVFMSGPLNRFPANSGLCAHPTFCPGSLQLGRAFQLLHPSDSLSHHFLGLQLLPHSLFRPRVNFNLRKPIRQKAVLGIKVKGGF